MPFESSWPLVGYLLTFGVATLASGIAAVRARKIEAAETRRGLVALLVTTAGWAFFQLGTLVVSDGSVAYGLHVLSLIVGLATVGAWLYFCSAYTGRQFHRDASYRRVAAAAYLGIVVVKLTNPVHGLYFDAELVSTPFVHLAVQHGVVHWVVSGIAYALASVGLFMLYELFLEVDYDTRPLGVLAAATALPVTLDLVGVTTGLLLEINYEPLGVAVFAVGVLYVFEDRFFAVQLVDDVDDAVVHLDTDGRIRELNGRARERFPQLAGAVGESFADAFPAAAERLGAADRTLESDYGDETRYYLVSDVSATLGQTDIVQSVVFTDITEVERQRRELERHNAQLEGFAAAIRHNLLNTLQVVVGRLNHADTALGAGEVREAGDSLAEASRAVEDMSGTVADLAALARDGQTVETTSRVSLAETARDAFDRVETADLALSVATDGTVQANRSRLQRLLETSVEFALYNEATTVTVALRDDGFEVTDDGNSLPDADVEGFFEYGRAVPDSDAGMILPNLQMLARTQGWEATVDTDYDDGFRLVVSGATTARAGATTHEQQSAEA